MSRPFTYSELGATQQEPLPAGYQHERRATVVGHGRATFDAVAHGIMRWEIQRGAGMRIDTRTPDVDDGVEVVAGAGIGPIRLPIPCRVVWTVREDDRVGFAYGTLKGHPVSGEEAFVVSLGNANPLVDAGPDVVVFSVVAFSRPARWFTRAGGPLGQLSQRVMTRAYLRSARRLGARG